MDSSKDGLMRQQALFFTPRMNIQLRLASKGVRNVTNVLTRRPCRVAFFLAKYQT
jgi:hypothetical protein